MKKLLFLFALIFCLSIFSFSQEAIYAVVQNDTVTIWHVETERNCGSAYKMEFDINGNDITLYQVDTVGAILFCMCHFDLSATLTNLLPGYYEVDVYSVGDGTSANDTTFWGSTSFTILSGDGIPQLLANTQSDCYDPTSIKEPEFNNLVKLFPNPADEYIIIEMENNDFNVQVEDILGNVVIVQESYENKTRIDLSEIQAGIYFITVNSSENKIVRKFIKR